MAWETRDGELVCTFATGTFVAGVEFLTALTELAEAAQHHPDVLVRYGSVEVRLSSHDVGAITDRDFALAEQIDALAQALGIAPRS